jgi:hypothetical protein
MLAPFVDPKTGETTTASRSAVDALERLTENLSPDEKGENYKEILTFLLSIEHEIHHAHSRAEHASFQITAHTQKADILESQCRELRSVLHQAGRDLATLATAARAVCDRLNDLDPAELSEELVALRLALTTKRIEQIEHLLEYSTYSIDIERVIMQMFRRLNAKPKLASAATKWVLEQLKRTQKPWWTLDRMSR